MSVIFNFNDFQINELYFTESVKNNVKTNSYFNRIIYSTDYFSLKNIYFNFTISNFTYKEQYLKTIIYFKESENDFNVIYEIERQILNKFIQYKQLYNIYLQPVFSIQNQFKHDYIKVFKNNNIYNNETEIFLKISGIWQTDNNVGITYKFI